ncbi:MAG: protein-ADP-ribose hydrolase [Lachnospiraceae bacterium]|nr:protein-ADP-ribose hydrolase [Lachnospiraceae bacterium]
MDQTERRNYLIKNLINEQPRFRGIKPEIQEDSARRQLRSLMNIRMPAPITKEFEEIQDAYLKEENGKRGIITVSDMEEVEPGIYLWQGDITRLAVDGIVNAANSGMTGCYQPCHNCIDNCIHTYAGIQLRNACAKIMEKQGHEEPTGQAKITPGFNLPCKYVLHTVGPVVDGPLTNEHEKLLASCYRSCLELADDYKLKNLAFCCISTGVFMFPNERAAQIAVQTVRDYRRQTGSRIEVIFNVWKDKDYELYRKLFGRD